MDTLMSLQMSDPIAQHLGSWSQEINVLSICLRIALPSVYPVGVSHH